jgi:nucleoside-triphosphatase THEP1
MGKKLWECKMQHMRHLFLTGEKQVGKSTLIRNFLLEQSLEAAGFFTLPFDIGGERKGYVLHSLRPMPPYENNSPVVIRTGERSHMAVVPVFETIGVKIIEESLLAPCSLLVMDELGKAEREANGFRDAVNRCLNGTKPVLGVLQKGDYPFYHDVTCRKEIQLLYVTEDNRAMVGQQIRDWAYDIGILP